MFLFCVIYIYFVQDEIFKMNEEKKKVMIKNGNPYKSF